MAVRYYFLATLSLIEHHLYSAKAQTEDENHQGAVESLKQASEVAQRLNMTDGKPVHDLIDMVLPELESGGPDKELTQAQIDGAVEHVQELRDSFEIG